MAKAGPRRSPRDSTSAKPGPRPSRRVRLWSLLLRLAQQLHSLRLRHEEGRQESPLLDLSRKEFPSNHRGWFLHQVLLEGGTREQVSFQEMVKTAVPKLPLLFRLPPHRQEAHRSAAESRQF